MVLQREGEKKVVSSVSREEYTYEHVFGEEKTNRDIFGEVVSDLVDKGTEGYNVCVFTYGQTASGKTHTMKGSEADPGIIPRALERVFEKTGSLEGRGSVKIDYMEIYNETINDLLKRGNGNLELKMDPDLSLKVKGLTQVEVTDAQTAIQLL